MSGIPLAEQRMDARFSNDPGLSGLPCAAYCWGCALLRCRLLLGPWCNGSLLHLLQLPKCPCFCCQNALSLSYFSFLPVLGLFIPKPMSVCAHACTWVCRIPEIQRHNPGTLPGAIRSGQGVMAESTHSTPLTTPQSLHLQSLHSTSTLEF